MSDDPRTSTAASDAGSESDNSPSDEKGASSSGPDVTIADSHFSEHHMEGSEGTHAISQEIHADGESKIAYTDMDDEGNVGESGIDDKKS